MSHAELVKRLQTGHDSHCAMSYGMHEHCCDCSFPDRAEAVATIEQLQADLAAARALLREASSYCPTTPPSMIGQYVATGDKIDAALAEGKP